MKVLFVCLGNICRSPMAEGVFQKMIQDHNLNIEVDSAGTGGWHAGEAPDQRMQETASSKGIDISGLRARKFVVEDFDRFDLIYTMDEENHHNVLKLARSAKDESKVMMILNEIYPGENQSVPDPYFGGASGFEHVYDLLHRVADKKANEWNEG